MITSLKLLWEIVIRDAVAGVIIGAIDGVIIEAMIGGLIGMIIGIIIESLLGIFAWICLRPDLWIRLDKLRTII